MTEKHNSISYCIICGKNFDGKVAISKEHIIPEALGNEKILTYNVCEDCNNQLGAHVDSYLTEHFIVRAIRKSKLEKDSGITLFDDTLKNERGEKYRIRDDGPRVIPRILERDKNHAKFIADPRDAKSYAIHILKKKFKMSQEEIDEILNDPLRYVEGHKDNIIPGVFIQDISLDKSRYLLVAIKMGYEYAFEKIGNSYSEDSIAQRLRAYLYAGRNGKRNFSDKEFAEISKYCQIVGLNPEVRQFFEDAFQCVGDAVSYLIFITRNKANKMICCIRILNEDMLSFAILLSEDATKYMRERQTIISFVTNQGEFIEC